MLLQNKRVAIIGAGPVGLTTAKLLQQCGADVRVYERDKNAQARIMGGTLDIHKELGQKALQKAGLLEAFYTLARPTGERAADIKGAIVMDELPTDDGRYDRPEIDRNDLRTLLLNHLKPGTAAWGRKLVSAEEHEGKWLLHFDGQKSEMADLVIGANGGLCNLRKQVTDVAPGYTGTVIVQGEVLHPDTDCPHYKQLCGTGNLMVMGEQKMLFSQTKANGALHFYLSFRQPESWLTTHGLNFDDKASIVSFLASLLPHWHSSYHELLAAADAFTLLPMRKMPLNEPWKTKSNITLVGDAAHVMPPFAGIGVNIGLMDALHIAHNLTSDEFYTIEAAIGDYEMKMFDYARQAQQDTSEAEAGIHSDQCVEEIIRDRR